MEWGSLTDQQLVTRTLRGERAAYGALVGRHQARVYAIAYRLVGEQQEALDLTQDAFVRAYTALATFDLRRPFAPWINRIVTNCALTTLQRRVPNVSLLPEDEADSEALTLPDLSGEPERLFLVSEQQETLRRAILALPAHYRVVIELRHFQELSYEAIAETLDIPLSDVKSHLFRARRWLRKRLEEPG